MGQRESDPRLQELYDQNKNVYSISKLNTIDNCEYEAWNTYVQHERGKNGIYGILGGKIHDKLEQIMNGEATEDELLPTLKEELDDLEMLGIDFPKDFKGGTSIRDNWIADMEHFCKNFVKPSGKFTTEELLILQLSEDRYFHGYSDLVKHNKDKSIGIYDWKTSSQFTTEDLIHHGRQLVSYAISKENEGYRVKDVAWIMLKYVEITFTGKARVNSKEESKITKVVNRGKIITELLPHLQRDLEKIGLDELDIDIILDDSLKNISLDNLPIDIQNKYTIKPYVRKYEITDELRKETLDYLNKMADLFEGKSKDEEDWKPREFTKLNKSGKAKDDTFFCNVLCNHRDTCKYIKKFNVLKDTRNSDEEDLF